MSATDARTDAELLAAHVQGDPHGPHFTEIICAMTKGGPGFNNLGFVTFWDAGMDASAARARVRVRGAVCVTHNSILGDRCDDTLDVFSGAAFRGLVCVERGESGGGDIIHSECLGESPRDPR